MDIPAIDVNELVKIYRSGGPRVVDGVSLQIPPGIVFGFLGPNGAGKTTTIKIAAGLLAPTSGRVRLGGYDVTRQRAQAMGQFGAVLEGSRNVYWTLSAWQNLLYFGRLKGLRKAEARSRAEELLTDLELWDRRDEPVGRYSRGMQQKVAIAAALIADPAIVLLDEPTLGLDVQATRTVKEWIRTLSNERGKTVLLTTHQLDVVEEVCDRVGVIRSGRMVADVSTDALLRSFRQHDRYEVTIDGRVPDRLVPAGFRATTREGSTVLSGQVTDPDEVYTLLEQFRDHRLVLQSVTQVQPDLEDVFLTLVGGNAIVRGEA